MEDKSSDQFEYKKGWGHEERTVSQPGPECVTISN